MIFDPGPLRPIGYLRRTHGYQGLVKFEAHTGCILNEGEPFFLVLQGKPVPFFIEELSGHQKNQILKISGIQGEERADELLGYEVFQKGQAEESAEDLIGYQLYNGLEPIGQIVEVIQRPPQDLLMVQTIGQEVLIPLTADWVVEIQPVARILIMELPEGLLDS